MRKHGAVSQTVHTHTLQKLQRCLSPSSRHAERRDFHGGSHDQGSLRGVANSKFVMHEAAVNNGLVLQHNLVTVAALQSLLVTVTLVGTILHLLEVPYHTELPYRGN